MEEAIEVPAALIKLERMRARARGHLAASREQQGRVNELTEEIRSLKERNLQLSEETRRVHGAAAPGSQYPADRIANNQRTVAALEAMLTVAQAALDEHHEHADEVRIYQSTSAHLLGELRAWGIA